MLYAALVDADWRSSAEHFEPDYLTRHTGAPLALFAFAAKHCVEHQQMRRIVIILSYLSIIEQNAQVYRDLIPDMMEKHMNVRWTEENARLAERWDAPCIVTTAVRFFEPLFSATAGECRHLHQLANSVIVLDEAQSLPPHLLDATLRTVKLLCRDHGCTAVFSTATQPFFRCRPGLDWQPREIVPDPAALFRATRRVTWDWRLDQPASFDSLAEEASAHPQCCIILNLKKHADTLAARLTECGADSVLLLTTDLCPAHRSDVLAQVRARLAAGQPCRLVATQRIEAGVDVDFPVLYRALAPLEAIIQAAGRCNRNGDGPDGRVTVFVPVAEDRLYPTAAYARAADCVRILLARHPIDPGDMRHIDGYYQLLYQYGEGDAKALRQAIQAEDYPGVEKAYRMIDQGGVQVIVPYAGRRALYEELRREIDETGLTADILCRARELTVSTYDIEGVKGCCQALYLRRHGQAELAEKPCYLLGNDAYYDERRGLHVDRERELIL